ncbi:hypothetical protein PR048_017492 [Dryococelus australis]|uniref:Uncharacterized protein n=1 Tax=Dryococelus australis TaxID=614101 RepID=A0ABQ9H9P7_9NEOP|nr:hypothetical protein PR048_017492 [Dryococelus australis]
MSAPRKLYRPSQSPLSFPHLKIPGWGKPQIEPYHFAKVEGRRANRTITDLSNRKCILTAMCCWARTLRMQNLTGLTVWSSAGMKGREIPEKSPPTSGIVRHDSHLRRSGVNRTGIEPGSPWEASRAAVVERLARSPPTKENRVLFPAGSLRIFVSGNRAGRCHWSAGFLGNLPPFHSSAAPYSPKSPTSALKTSLALPACSYFACKRVSSKVGSCSLATLPDRLCVQGARRLACMQPFRRRLASTHILFTDNSRFRIIDLKSKLRYKENKSKGSWGQLSPISDASLEVSWISPSEERRILLDDPPPRDLGRILFRLRRLGCYAAHVPVWERRVMPCVLFMDRAMCSTIDNGRGAVLMGVLLTLKEHRGNEGLTRSEIVNRMLSDTPVKKEWVKQVQKCLTCGVQMGLIAYKRARYRLGPRVSRKGSRGMYILLDGTKFRRPAQNSTLRKSLMITYSSVAPSTYWASESKSETMSTSTESLLPSSGMRPKRRALKRRFNSILDEGQHASPCTSQRYSKVSSVPAALTCNNTSCNPAMSETESTRAFVRTRDAESQPVPSRAKPPDYDAIERCSECAEDVGPFTAPPSSQRESCVPPTTSALNQNDSLTPPSRIGTAPSAALDCKVFERSLEGAPGEGSTVRPPARCGECEVPPTSTTPTGELCLVQVNETPREMIHSDVEVVDGESHPEPQGQPKNHQNRWDKLIWEAWLSVYQTPDVTNTMNPHRRSFDYQFVGRRWDPEHGSHELERTDRCSVASLEQSSDVFRRYAKTSDSTAYINPSLLSDFIEAYRRGKWGYPDKTRRRAASSSTISTCKNPGASPPRIEPGSPWWEASALATAPPLTRTSTLTLHDEGEKEDVGSQKQCREWQNQWTRIRGDMDSIPCPANLISGHQRYPKSLQANARSFPIPECPVFPKLLPLFGCNRFIELVRYLVVDGGIKRHQRSWRLTIQLG